MFTPDGHLLVSARPHPVNDAPVAVDDSARGVAGQPIAIPVLANDTEVDGQADVVDAILVDVKSGAAVTVSAGIVTFTALQPGVYTYTYRAVDQAGAFSQPATVTVGALETVTAARAEYTARSLRWRVEGISNILSGQTVYITYDDGVMADGLRRGCGNWISG